jgi:RecG-like helicase
MNIKRISLIFSVIGILLLYLVSILSQPSNIKLHELPEFEGKEVTTSGVVTEHHTTQYGSQMITIHNDDFTAIVFIEGKTDVEYGDKIQVTGEVQKYKEDWEIIVNNPRFISTVQKWNNISFPIWQLAENPARYVGLNVNVTGFIDSVFDSYFYLADLDEKYSLMVFHKSSNLTLYSGKGVCVRGKFLFDEKNLRYVLEVCDENHGISLLI